MSKKYEIPEEIKETHDAFLAFATLRNMYIKRPLGFKKAAKAGQLLEKKRRLFWDQLRELYPELSGKDLEYNEGFLTVTEQTNE